MQEKARTE